VFDFDPIVAPKFPEDTLIDIGGTYIYASRTFTFEDDGEFLERLELLPKYKVVWTPPGITDLTFPCHDEPWCPKCGGTGSVAVYMPDSIDSELCEFCPYGQELIREDDDMYLNAHRKPWGGV
jgi:hypothetical protein